MKKLICMVALAAISFGSVYAAPVQQDTTKVKVKKKGDKTKIKKKTKDSSKKDTVMKM
jgi:uncharacterized ion transporter superfamily protein YfcC